MRLKIEVVSAGATPPAGSPVVVEIRDAGLQDAAATTLAQKRTRSRTAAEGRPFAHVELELPEAGAHAIVWVHVDVDNSGDVSAGDYVTMQSYPVRAGEKAMKVEVRRVD